jgi:hypothetical protein
VDTLLPLCWCSVDALLTHWWRSFWGVAVSTHTILLVKAAITSIMDKCCSTTLGLHKMQHTNLLTLCWRSVDAVLTLCWLSSFRVVKTTLPLLPIQVANSSIMDRHRSLAFGFYQMQYPKFLTLCVCCIDTLLTFIFRCRDIDIYRIDYNRAQYADYVYKP